MTHFAMGLSLRCAVSWMSCHLALLLLFLSGIGTTPLPLASSILPFSALVVSAHEFVDLTKSSVLVILPVRNSPPSSGNVHSR
jgi:hypothetical protein